MANEAALVGFGPRVAGGPAERAAALAASVDGWIDDMPPALAHEYAARRVERAAALHLAPAGAVYVTPITALDISATAIRASLRARRSPRYLLPDAVLDYIRANHLYL